MLGSSGTCPHLYLHHMCPYRISLGGDATARNLLLAEVPFPMQSMLVQRSCRHSPSTLQLGREDAQQHGAASAERGSRVAC